MRATHIVLRAEVEARSDASQKLTSAGDAVLVRRQIPRSIALSCPDGCGDELTVNLDPRTGRAWRLYGTDGTLTLWPSIWRDSGCRSHFIVWRNKIVWCDGDDFDWLPPQSNDLDERVFEVLKVDTWQSPLELAETLNESPWEVRASCKALYERSKILRKQRGWTVSYKLP